MQLRLASTRGDAAHLGNLLMFVSLHVVQNENVSRSSRQLCHRIRQVHVVTVCRGDRRSLYRRLTTICFVFNKSHPVSDFRFSIGEDDVHCNAMNPRRERRFSPELRKFFPRPYKNILRQLFTPHPASTHPRANREHPVHVRLVQPFERTPVPGRGQCHIRRVVRRSGRLDHPRCCQATLATIS